MGTQIITQPQTFKHASTVMGAAAGLSAVSGLTVYGDISASGTIYGTVGTLAPIITNITTNGVTTYTFSGYTNTTAANYLVYLDGVHQIPSTDYTITSTSGGSIVFSSAPASGVVASILAFQTAVAAYSLGIISPIKTVATGTGSQTAFGVTGYTTATSENYLVSVGGLIQIPGTDYNATGGGVTFTTAPPNGAIVLIIAYQR